MPAKRPPPPRASRRPTRTPKPPAKATRATRATTARKANGPGGASPATTARKATAATRPPAARKRGRAIEAKGPVARLREICLAFPDAIETISHGEPIWRAGKGRTFAILDDHHHGAPHLSVWLPQPLGRQEELIDADPELFFRPPYVGPSGWVGVVLDGAADWGMVASLIEDAFRHVATRKLVARLDDSAPAPPPARRQRAR